jgi:hypothetical protein
MKRARVTIKTERTTMGSSMGFVRDGRSRAEDAVIASFRERRPALIAALRQEYAAELATAGWLQRARLRLRIRREVAAMLREDLDLLASPDSLY